MNKAECRVWAKERRRGMNYEPILPDLFTRLIALPEWQRARHILLYLALPDELPVERITVLQTGRDWYLPRCEKGRRLGIYSYVPGETALVVGSFGLQEPDATQGTTVEPEVLDLVVLPALLYSEQGVRLGYGGGYYDRFLPRLRPDCVTVGVLPDALVVPGLPVETHDAPVDVVVTGARTIRRADTIGLIPRPD